MVAYSNPQQYPHVRAMRTCLACGGGKHVGLLVCWPCHNALQMTHDRGYGPQMERVLMTADEQRARLERDREQT